jgi:AcrR family transcriptional regulator
MPKPTFLNLPDEKRNRIVELALDEFSTHPYRQASLSRIVARAGIAKGSMYQYFENKLDLYQWLVTEELERRREEWLQQHDLARPEDRETGSKLFAALERMVSIRVGFMLAHPRLARLAASAMEPTVDAELRELHETLRRDQIDRLADRIHEAQVVGEIRTGVAVRPLAHFIDALVVRGTTNALLDRLGLEVHEFLTGTHADLDEGEWRALVEQALDLICNGIKHASTEAHSNGPSGVGSDPDPRSEPQLTAGLTEVSWA